ncbi:hypothetical protein ACFLXU_05270 [Chloroflexota bacterium]
MSKILRLLTVSLLLASIMIATGASVAFAADLDRDRDYTECDCVPAGDPYRYQGDQ